jgi:hypothetical protein
MQGECFFYQKLLVKREGLPYFRALLIDNKEGDYEEFQFMIVRIFV